MKKSTYRRLTEEKPGASFTMKCDKEDREVWHLFAESKGCTLSYFIKQKLDYEIQQEALRQGVPYDEYKQSLKK